MPELPEAYREERRLRPHALSRGGRRLRARLAREGRITVCKKEQVQTFGLHLRKCAAIFLNIHENCPRIFSENAVQKIGMT